MERLKSYVTKTGYGNMDTRCPATSLARKLSSRFHRMSKPRFCAACMSENFRFVWRN
jgi:hypothetical protein